MFILPDQTPPSQNQGLTAWIPEPSTVITYGEYE